MMKAHQRIIREQKAAIAEQENLFGAWWKDVDVDIKKAQLKEIDFITAAAIIEEYEYLGTMAAGPRHAYGIYFEGNCAGVILFTTVNPASVAQSIIKPPYDEKVIQLSRGACVHWAHPHSASKLISYGLRQIEAEGWRIVVAYADPKAGEIGTVYQATNWLYCGRTEARPDYFIAGKRITKHVGKIKPWMTRGGIRSQKGRYIFILGNKSERKIIRKNLLWKPEPYPKRELESWQESQSAEIVAHQ